ncbi:unnamed protein product, partial [Candidula unifasciata]
MSDSLPTISADQLTKAVCLAAAGTLSALETDGENEAVFEWQNYKTIDTVKPDTRHSSLKCLETLSTSVSSGLGRLNHLHLDKPCPVYSTRSLKSNAKQSSKNEKSSSSVTKVYSSRKNYKLMPPLIPSEVRTDLKKPAQKLVQQRQLVTLSHVHSSPEFKSFPVRPASYATNYVFVRTAHIVPSVPGGEAAVSSVASPSTSSVSSSPTTASCVKNVNFPVSESSVTTTASAAKLPIGTPVLLPFSQMEQGFQSTPSLSLTLTAHNDIKHPARLVPSTKLQPLFRLPFPVSNINSNVVVKAVTLSNEANTLNQVKENLCVDAANSHSESQTILIDSETASLSDSVLKQQVLSTDSSSKPVVCSIKQNIVPVSAPASELSLLTSFPSPIIVTAKLSHGSTLTVDSKPFPSTVSTKSSHLGAHTAIIPQPGSVTSASSSTTSPDDTKSSGSVMSPSRHLSPVTDGSSLQTFDTPRLKSPVILSHLVKSINKQHIATQASVVRLTSSHLGHTKPLNRGVISKGQALVNKKCNSNRSNDRMDNVSEDHCMDVQDSMHCITAISLADNQMTSLVPHPASQVEEPHLTRANTARLSTSDRSKYLIEANKSVKRDCKGPKQKRSRTMQPRLCPLIPVSPKSSERIDSQATTVKATTTALLSTSLATPFSIAVSRETNTIFTPNLHSIPSTPQFTPAGNVSPASSCMSKTESEDQQNNGSAVNMTTFSTQHHSLTVLAVPHKLQQIQKPSNEQNIQLTSKFTSTGSWPPTPPSDLYIKDVNAFPCTVSSQVTLPRAPSVGIPLLPSPKEPSVAPQSTSDMSVPLSKEVAAAAMVSLSTMCDFSDSENTAKISSKGCFGPNQQIINSSGCAQPTQAYPPFLIHSSDKSKLVISPAGIEHLQSLLRKQGISEGYFIITSPRTPSSQTDRKPLPAEPNANISLSESPHNSRNNLFTKKAAQASVSVSSEKYQTSSLPVSTFVRTFDSKKVHTQSHSVEVHGRDDGLVDKEESLDLESDESDNEHCSSSDSRSSSAALVIETGEEDDKIEMDRQGSDLSPRENDEAVREDIFTSESNEIKTASDESSTAQRSLPKLTQDTAWESESMHTEDTRQCIPQSPLSLSDLVRQQQNRPGFSRHLEYTFLTSPENKMKEAARRIDSESPRPPSTESHDFQFPVPLCPASTFSMASQHHHHHSGSDIQPSFQQNMFVSAPSFSTDLSFDSGVQENPPDTSPKLLPSSVNAPSPKSPLSVSSSQNLDQNAPLNPPMTPNTMLINLLNRVPTPFLTNPQEILSIPASQESAVQESDSAACFEITDSKDGNGMYSTKNLGFPSGQSHTQLDGTGGAGDGLLYTESSTSLSNTTANYAAAHNALELIASNYSPNSTRHNVLSHDMSSSRLPSSFSMNNSKSFNHSSYTHCNVSGESQPLHFSGSFQQETENGDVCNVFHCKSCPGPLLVTVNLEPEMASREQKAAESLLGNYEHTHMFDPSLSLQEHGCNGGRSEVSRMGPEKSRDTDILRHLILNTSSSSLHTLQPVQNLRSQYSNSASTYNMPQTHHAQDTQFECRVESFLEPENQHKPLSAGEINQSSTFSSQDESFLHVNHVHTRPSPSYDNSSTSFQAAHHQSYENTASGSFDNRNSSSLSSQTDASYIMQRDMTNEAPFGVQNMTKNNMAMPHDFLESGNRLQHLAPFRTNHQTELFYQHSDQSELHQHHYDTANQHQGLEYHLDSLPSSHPPHHQFSASLPHQDSTRMYSDQVGNEYMSGQYQSQYYDGGSVASNLPMFPQQCVVGSEAPAIGSAAEHPCNIPFSTAPSELQLGFRFPSDDEDGNNIEKQPVLPSVSFSPPSVADQAATPDPGGMSMYQGSFPNISMYDMYMRGGNGDARGVTSDTVQESGNFCVECNIMYKSQCKFHPCDYVYITDTPILSHARLTLPSCLKLGTSSVVGHINNTGVFAKEKIALRTKFGPLIGSPVSCDKLSSTRSFSLWQTFIGTNVKVVDTNDENSSNWLMFVKPARVSLEQNLVAFQHGTSVYFVTRADIEPGQELLYWFSKDYSHMLGMTSKSKNSLHQLCPHCPVCKQVFPDRKQ